MEKPKRVTRNDVAMLAGVSPAVVSYVINSSKFVSEEKKRAVLQAIDALQYRPNVQARGLKTNRSMQIAFVCDNLLNYWLEDAETFLFEQGYYVSHCYSRDSQEFIQMLIDRQFDAVFMMSNRFTSAQLNEILDAGIPIVLYKTRKYGDLHPGIAAVAPDYRGGVAKSVNYLAMKGHKRIALIPPLRYKTKGVLDDGFRITAYLESLGQNGLEIRPEFVCTETDSMEAINQSVMNMLLSGKPEARPTAFIACNDYVAVQVINRVKSLGLRVPEDVAVIGADNTYLAETVSPSLTTVDFSKEEFSQKLTKSMLALIHGEQPEDAFIEVSLVIRESA